MLPICNSFSSFSSFPSELKALDQWVIHRKKIPYDAKTVRNASVSDSATWSSFEKALKVCTENHYDGLGFVFTDGQGYVGIDIDTCRDPATNRISDGAKNLINLFDSYTEISPSGYGIHIFIRADAGFKLPRHRYKMKPNGILRTDPATNKQKTPELEIYNGARYFTVTGNVYGTLKPIAERTKELHEFLAKYAKTKQSPQQITLLDKPYSLSNQEIIEKASRSDKTFLPLYYGGNLHYASDSEADLVFCNKLVFWTGGNEEQIDQIFRNSHRMRDKWNEKCTGNMTYGQHTIQKAMDDATGYYDPDYRKSAKKPEYEKKIMKEN